VEFTATTYGGRYRVFKVTIYLVDCIASETSCRNYHKNDARRRLYQPDVTPLRVCVQNMHVQEELYEKTWTLLHLGAAERKSGHNIDVSPFNPPVT